MTVRILGRLAGAMAITLALAGCIDMTMDLDIQSDTTGKATVTTLMGADFYPMVKASASGENKSADTEGFCNEADSTLTENADGSATCVQVREGAFANLMEGEDNGMTITQVSPGVVRVAFDTKSMKGDLASSTGSGEEEMDEQTKAMITGIFTGHTITMRVHGKEVTDTNMELSADHTTAEKAIPFVDLINGTTDLPDELYAVVKTN